MTSRLRATIRKHRLAITVTLAVLTAACAGATVGVSWGVGVGPGPYGYPGTIPMSVGVYGRPY
jgi:hypothetical protein